MLNPMMSVLMRNNPIKQAVNMATNPNAMMQQMFAGNPNFAQAQQLVQQAGGDARKAFYDLAQQMGVDPEQILSQLK